MSARPLKTFLDATAASLWQYRGRNVISVMIICLSFLIVGVFQALSNNLGAVARRLESNMTVTFYLSASASPADVEALEAEAKAQPFVSSVRAVPAAEALERFKGDFPDLEPVLSNLGVNPFPSSVEARVAGAAGAAREIAAFVERMRARPGVEDAQFNRDWVEKMDSLGRLARAVGFLLGGILVLASFFIISNVIKLNVFARRGEIEILRLVGATNLFIRVPFWLEGMVLGLLGSLASLLLLTLVVKLFPLYVGPTLGAVGEILQFRFLTGRQIAMLLAGGAGIGFLGSASSVSRFLKV